MASFQYSCGPTDLVDNGPRIAVEISATESEIKEQSRLGFEFPSSPLRIEALVDTGSNVTWVTPEVVHKCKLRATNLRMKSIIIHGGGVREFPEHAAWIRFPGTGLREFCEIPVLATEIQTSKRPYDCLIGRDILRRWLLTYSGHTGSVTFRNSDDEDEAKIC